jgi:hypothetical protein
MKQVHSATPQDNKQKQKLFLFHGHACNLWRESVFKVYDVINVFLVFFTLILTSSKYELKQLIFEKDVS